MNLRQNVRVWGCREGGCVVGVKLKGWPAPTWSTSYDRERDEVVGLDDSHTDIHLGQERLHELPANQRRGRWG